MITCEITLPGTSYREVRWRKIPKLPMEFTSTSAAKPNANSINGIVVPFFSDENVVFVIADNSYIDTLDFFNFENLLNLKIRKSEHIHILYLIKEALLI